MARIVLRNSRAREGNESLKAKRSKEHLVFEYELPEKLTKKNYQDWSCCVTNAKYLDN